MILRAGCFALCLQACGEPRETLHCVADRAAGELVVLDRELCARTRIPAPSPRLLVAAGGALWAAAGPPGAARLLHVDADPGSRIDPGTQATSAIGFTEIVALAGAPDGDGVLVLARAGEDAGETLLWSVGAAGERTLLGAFVRARAVAAREREILVGCASGELVRLRPDGAVEGGGRVDGPVRALACGPRTGEWWVLAGEDASVLALVDRSLAPLWSVCTDLDARRFAPVAGEERAWIAAEDRLRRYGPGGELELAYALPAGAWEAHAASGRTVLLLGAGALLELSARGTRVDVRRTQGGFSGLAALAVTE